MRGKVKGAGRQLSGADDDLDFRIIASLVQPLQHAGLLTNQGRRRLMLFLAPSWLVAKTNLWPCRGGKARSSTDQGRQLLQRAWGDSYEACTVSSLL